MRAPMVLLAGLLVMQTAYATEPSTPVVKVTMANDGKTVALKTGQPMEVVLESNRTTGFSWSVGKFDTAILTLVGQAVYAVSEAKPGMTGVGGTETWHFVAAAPGEQPLKFVYRRPFEANARPARTFTFTVRILP